MADLRTDYRDDILDLTQNTQRKYRMINNDDGTVSFEDLTDYLQVGDSFGSADVNAITKKLTEDVLDTKEEIEANTEENKIAGALAVKEVIEEVNAQFAKKSDVIHDKVGCSYIDSTTLYAKIEHNFGGAYTVTATLDVSGISYGELPDMQVWVGSGIDYTEIFVKGSDFTPSSGIYVQYIIHKA